MIQILCPLNNFADNKFGLNQTFKINIDISTTQREGSERLQKDIAPLDYFGSDTILSKLMPNYYRKNSLKHNFLGMLSFFFI